MGRVFDLIDVLEEAASVRCRIMFIPDNEWIDFSEVWASAEKAGAWLCRRSEPGTAIGMLLMASKACVAALLGAWRAGYRVVSLPLPARATAPADYLNMISSMLSAAEAQLLLVPSEYLSLVPPEFAVRFFAFDDCLSFEHSRIPPKTSGGGLIQFTSGSISQPKGLPISLHQIAANLDAIVKASVPPGSHETACSWLPLSHDMGLGILLSPLVASVTNGAPCDLIIMRPEEFIRSPSTWLELLSDHGVTYSAAPNFALGLATRTLMRIRNLRMDTLRVLVVGGERVHASTLREFELAAGNFGLSSTAICPGYGLAENVLGVTLVRPNQPWASRTVDAPSVLNEHWVERDDSDGIELVSTGAPLPGTEVKVVSATASDARVGEVRVRSASMATEYLDGASTLDEAGWLRTRDLGAVIDGELYPVDRLDDVLVVRGKNLSATEIEMVACQERAVRRGNCAAIPGSRGHYLLVAEPNTEMSSSELRESARVLRGKLERSVGVAPSSIIFIEPGTLPKTSSGKAQRWRVLAAIESERLPVLMKVEPSQ